MSCVGLSMGIRSDCVGGFWDTIFVAVGSGDEGRFLDMKSVNVESVDACLPSDVVF